MWALWWLTVYMLFVNVYGVFTAHRDRKPTKVTPTLTLFTVLINIVLGVVPGVFAVMELLHM